MSPSPKPRSYPALSVIAGLLKVVSVFVFLGGFLVGLAALAGDAGFAALAATIAGCTIVAIILWASAESILVLVNLSVDLSRVLFVAEDALVAFNTAEFRFRTTLAQAQAPASTPDLSDPAVLRQIVTPRT
jgi:hypothetical protein